MIGCNIDMSSEVPEVSFKQKEANAFINSKHPLFVAASAASTCTNPELQEYVAKYSFAASPLNDIVIHPGDQKTFKVEINTDMHLQLQPGAMVLVQADGLATKHPSAVLETTFVNVENENKIQVTLANKSTKVTELPKEQPIPGLLIQSMVAYHTPVEIQKEDIQIMANASKVVKEAEDSIPGFKQHIENIAAA
jgi:dUTPase